MLRAIYCSLQDKGRWRPRRTSEICNLQKALNIVDDIEFERLGWLGLFIKMESERIHKEEVRNGKFDNARPVGKAGTRWEDVIRRDTTRKARMEETNRRQRKMEALSEVG